MSWSISFIGTREEVLSGLAGVNPESCGASGAIEKGEVAFIKYHAMQLVDQLGPSWNPSAKRIKASAHGSHSWSATWDPKESASPRPSCASFSLSVEWAE